MKKAFWERKIPSLIGIVLIIIGTIATSYLANIVSVRFFSNASPTGNPQSIRITNTTDTSFTITYQTDASVIGTVSLTGGVNQTILDDRDQQSGVPKPYHLHSLTAKNLKPQTTYSFSILSGATTFQNGGQPFQATTGPTITTPPTSQPPATGSLIEPNGQLPQEALLFVTTDGGQNLSTLAKPSGVYIIPLNSIRSKDLSSFLTIPSDSQLQVLATDGTNTSQAIVNANANSIPLITLSSNYDFTQNTIPLASSSATSSFPTFGLDTTVAPAPVITTPKKDEGFTDQQPEFSGKAPASTKVTITIHSIETIQTQVTTDNSGNWTYRPSQPLSPGQHTITITAPDSNGILRTIEQSFVVYAAGSQLDLTGTPTPTPTQSGPTPTPSSVQATPTLTPTVIPTPTQSEPTKSPSPTAIATPTNTPTIAPTRATITPKPSLPPTGSNDTVIGTFIGVVTAATGIALFVLTRGGLL